MTHIILDKDAVKITGIFSIGLATAIRYIVKACLAPCKCVQEVEEFFDNLKNLF